MSEPNETPRQDRREPARTGADDPLSESAEAERANAKSGKIPDIPERPREIGGPPGPEPTRYGDWEKKGRCIDF